YTIRIKDALETQTDTYTRTDSLAPSRMTRARQLWTVVVVILLFELRCDGQHRRHPVRLRLLGRVAIWVRPPSSQCPGRCRARSEATPARLFVRPCNKSRADIASPVRSIHVNLCSPRTIALAF